MNRKERRAARKRGEGAGHGLPNTPPAAAMFAEAVRYHQAGQLAEAEACCRQTLVSDRHHVGGLHLLGTIAQQRGRFADAAVCFGEVIRLKPDIAAAHFELGRVLAAQGKIAEAAAAFERALVLAPGSSGAADYPKIFLGLVDLSKKQGDLAQAVRLAERALALGPDHAAAHNSLGTLLLEQGKTVEATAHFVRALMLAPELYEEYPDLQATLFKLNRAVKDAAARAHAAWPRRLDAKELFGAAGTADIYADAMLRCMLESAPVRAFELERLLTSIRRVLLEIAVTTDVDEEAFEFACSLARQCFINEYVFAITPEEERQVEELTSAVNRALSDGLTPSALKLAVLASYVPLGSLPRAASLLDRHWPAPLGALLAQQVSEPLEERRSYQSIPRLTEIAAGVSSSVRDQYEQNPYPRWVIPPRVSEAITVDQDLRSKFPNVSFRALGDRASIDVLIAGCGTGQHPIGLAQRYAGSSVLAIDLSLASLAYALRKTREIGLKNIEYAQADILQLGSLGRTFDLVDANGVLHHLEDPMAGWTVLLGLLRPNGLMRIGLYSELARRDVVAARAMIAERGFRATPEDIRRFRSDLTGLGPGVVKSLDFFSLSDCRDLLWHVQERRLTIPQIRAFLDANGLKFIGFELDARSARAYRARYPEDRSMADLGRWHTFETERPETFARMYQFWVQRA